MNYDEFLKTCVVFQRSYKIIKKFPLKTSWINHILVVCLHGVVLFPTIILNAISAITILKSSQLKNKTCYFLILVQSTVDLAVGLVGIPLHSFFLISELAGVGNCMASSLAIRTPFIPCAMSIVTLSALTVERYIGVLHPYSYGTKVTIKRIVIYVACGGFFVVAVFGLSLHMKALIGNVLTAMILLFFITTVFAYTRIYLVVRRLARSRNRPADANEENSRRKTIFREVKHVKSCFIVILAFFVFLLPSLTSTFFFNRKEPFKFFAFQAWSILSLMMNSTVNSLIFFWTKTLLRKEAVKVLNKIFMNRDKWAL